MARSGCDSDETSVILRRSALFLGLDAGALEGALRFFEAVPERFAQGSLLQCAGVPMPHFGLVLTGIVRVSMSDINGTQMILANVTSGGTFGEAMCFLQQPEVPVEIRAAEDVTLLWLKTDAVRSGAADPLSVELRNRFIAMLAARTLQMNNRIQILSRSTLREKLVAFFSECAQEDGGETFSIPFDRSALAAYLGTERSALSRELSRMRRDGLIDYYKNSFRLLNRTARPED